MALFYGYILPEEIVEEVNFSATEMADYVADFGLQYHERDYSCSNCRRETMKYFAGIDIEDGIYGLNHVVDILEDDLTRDCVENLLRDLYAGLGQDMQEIDDENFAFLATGNPTDTHQYTCSNCMEPQNMVDVPP